MDLVVHRSLRKGAKQRGSRNHHSGGCAMCLIPRLERSTRIPALHFMDDAEGQLLSCAALPASEASEPGRGERYRWSGREWAAETCLMYNRARWYDPSVGR